MSFSTLLILHLAATCYLTGLCWMVQLVVYPQFARVGSEQFPDYHKAHMTWTTVAVVGVMIAEAVLATWILMHDRSDVLAMLGIILLGVIWINTFAQEVPIHHHLQRKHDLKKIRKLITWNWIRTVAWTARAAVAGWMVANAM